ncbi:Uncharacterised protein [Chryseobacterium gleum]|uniref:DUF4329 domain-containing protein n=2 Tax=Chryseobacterium gleum TaxID=250 RepID=A0A448B6G0_CHRGE|nr:hypothetical protein [Chryseobacterium gleum]EFK37938.1 hypothetical protein HMPREF0204_10711 [Chryseobacterium gleum ATCC 35910]QBJ87668.1 hypothetical protein DDI74_15955 [Chryseobacterium gleum]QQY32606.1 hypothetical protein I6I60_02085 [Chryseobacterium gleum]VEE10174.1 Uncharacterised protein [Chryseobacterium gleum]
MKKRFIMVLLLLAVFGFTLQSCRNDLLPGHDETYDNSNQFKLYSKIITLNESKHKSKLISELQKVEIDLKKTKQFFVGKTIDYDNFIIDTDHIVFMENGSHYHTYTFRVIRNTEEGNASVENLVFTPLSDGTYRKLLITYNFTPQEKEILMNGGYVNTKGKSTVTELGVGILPQTLGKGSTQSCGYVTAEAYTWCSEGVHHNGETDCTADEKSHIITVLLYVCTSVDDGSGSGGGGSSTGDGGGGDGPPITWVCPDPKVLTGPQQPGSDLGDESCYGVPTEPNVGGGSNNGDPCAKASIPVNIVNTLLHAPTISTELSALENHAKNDHYEYGTAIISTSTTPIAQDPYSSNDPNDPGHVSISIPSVGDLLAMAHTHPSHGASPPSAKDLYVTLQYAKERPTFQASFVFSSNGTKYALVVTDRAKAEAFLVAYPFLTNTTNEGRIFNKNYAVGSDFNTIYNYYMQGSLPSYSGSSQNDGMESAYAQILEKYDAGISFAKTDANGNLKPLRSVSFQYEIPASGGKKITGYRAEPCP